MAAPVFAVLVSDGRKTRWRRGPPYTALKTSMRLTPCPGHGVMAPVIELWKLTIFARRTSQIKGERRRFQTSRRPRFPSRVWSRFWLLLACRLRLNLPGEASCRMTCLRILNKDLHILRLVRRHSQIPFPSFRVSFLPSRRRALANQPPLVPWRLYPILSPVITARRFPQRNKSLFHLHPDIPNPSRA